MDAATPARADDTLPPFTLPAMCRRKVSARFDGGARLGGASTCTGRAPRITLRGDGDGHGSRPKGMNWSDANDASCILDLASTDVLAGPTRPPPM